MTIALLSHDIYSTGAIDQVASASGLEVRHEAGQSFVSIPDRGENTLDELLNGILILSAQERLS